jgi:glycine/D-amino acid oxidase-like deaminating enzyme/nitrite reductase/ring-hydroxylating ferredoxin subunit
MGQAGTSVGPWAAGTELPPVPVLNEDLTTDVCVVGAGIAGLSAAARIAEGGLSVVVLDREGIGAGETGRTTAHLTAAIDSRFRRLERFHGPEGARFAAASHLAAIETIAAHATRAPQDCRFEWVDGYLFDPGDDDPDALHEEAEAARRAGLEVEELPAPPLPFATGRCLRFPRQAQVHALRYLGALAADVRGGRGRIFRAEATEFEDGEPATVRTTSGPYVRARSVIVATDTPINDRFVIHTKQVPSRTYAVAFASPDGFPRGLFWDTLSPYHYVRRARVGPDPGEDVLIVGGEDHRTGEADEPERRYEVLEAWARSRLNGLGRVAHRWSGQVQEPVDGLAFIGRNPGDRHIYVATGFTGNGITHGTLAGALLVDLILGRPNDWARVYEPGRASLRAAPGFLRENAKTAGHYAELVSGGDVADVDEIGPGGGAIVRRGLRKVAVHRDESGELHERSAYCTHLGCVVAWNGAERTWDCPCHGSRFGVDGGVVHGPAVAPLAEVDDTTPEPRPVTA